MIGTVFVVDDDVVARTLIGTMMRRNGIRCFEASDAEHMWALFDIERPDVVILDVEMPGEDGFATAEKIRSRYGLQIAVIMLTGRSGEIDKIMGLEAGIDTYFTKPCDLPVLLKTVQRTLQTCTPAPAEAASHACPRCGGETVVQAYTVQSALLLCPHCGWNRTLTASR